MGGSLAAALQFGWLGALLARYHAWRTWRHSPEAARRRELRAMARADRLEKKQLVRVARLLARHIITASVGVGFCHRYRTDRGLFGQKIQTMTFTHAVVISGGTEVWYRLGRIPFNKTRWQLFTPTPSGGGHVQAEHAKPTVSWFCTELYLALARPVQIVFYEDVGIFLVVGLKQGIQGVPRLVLWDDPEGKQYSMMRGDPLADGKGAIPDYVKRPDTRYHMPIGMGRNQAVMFDSIVNIFHLLVAGTTGSGKSTFLNALLCTWLLRNSPKTLRLHLIDMKMTEFSPYYPLLDCEHGMVDDIAVNEDDALAVLEWMEREVTRRMEMFAEAGCTTIDGWRALGKPPIPLRILVFDELSLVLLSPNRDLRKKAQDVIARLLAVGRAQGVHMVLCTQAVNKEILSALVKANIPGRMIFRTAERNASIQAVGDGRAWTHLTQQGMAIYCSPWRGQSIVQAPMIEQRQRDEVIRTVLAGDHVAPEITYADVALYALNEFGREDSTGTWAPMRQTDMREAFKGQITQAGLDRWMARYDDSEFVCNGYVVRQSSGAGSRPRTVRCVAEHNGDVNCQLRNAADDIAGDEIFIGGDGVLGSLAAQQNGGETDAELSHE